MYRIASNFHQYLVSMTQTNITYAHQREQRGLAHALLTAEDYVDDEFMLMLGDNVFRANLGDVVHRHQEMRADAVFLVEEVPWEDASRYGVCDGTRSLSLRRCLVSRMAQTHHFFK